MIFGTRSNGNSKVLMKTVGMRCLEIDHETNDLPESFEVKRNFTSVSLVRRSRIPRWQECVTNQKNGLCRIDASLYTVHTQNTSKKQLLENHD